MIIYNLCDIHTLVFFLCVIVLEFVTSLLFLHIVYITRVTRIYYTTFKWTVLNNLLVIH